jgi:Protein of unknown function (DUF3800)
MGILCFPHLWAGNRDKSTSYDVLASQIGLTVGWGAPSRKGALVLACYLDDSGEKTDRIITMAGYLSLQSEWRDFEPRAREFLDAYGVPYLHTKDFHHGHELFTGWDWDRKATFANGLFDILRAHLGFGIEFSVSKARYHKVKAETQLNQNISAYGFCFMGVLDQLAKHQGVQDVLREPGVDITFIVERGNKNDRDVQNVFNLTQQHPDCRGLSSVYFADKKKFIALQMADFLAFYSRRLRTRNKQASRYVDESNFFAYVTAGIDHIRFLATDFG